MVAQTNRPVLPSQSPPDTMVFRFGNMKRRRAGRFGVLRLPTSLTNDEKATEARMRVSDLWRWG